MGEAPGLVLMLETSLRKSGRLRALFSLTSRHKRLLGLGNCSAQPEPTEGRFVPGQTPGKASHLKCEKALETELIAASKTELKVKKSSGYYCYYYFFNRMSSFEIKRASRCENKCFKRNISHQGVKEQMAPGFPPRSSALPLWSGSRERGNPRPFSVPSSRRGTTAPTQSLPLIIYKVTPL